MAQRTGALIFDERTDRYDIRFDLSQSSGSDSICESSPFAFRESSRLRKWWLLITVYPLLRSTRKTAIVSSLLCCGFVTQ